MDIKVPAVVRSKNCGEVPCGVCPRCVRRVLLHMAAYALRTEDPQGTLRDLMVDLGLPQQRELSGRKD